MPEAEANPAARAVFDAWGYQGLAWAKIGVLALTLAVLGAVARRDGRKARRVLWPAAALAGWAVWLGYQAAAAANR